MVLWQTEAIAVYEDSTMHLPDKVRSQQHSRSQQQHSSDLGRFLLKYSTVYQLSNNKTPQEQWL